MAPSLCRRSIALTAALLAATAALAQNSGADEYFEKKVRPLLVASCQPCHNANVKTSGLDLSTAAGLLSGGARGAVIARDAPESSRILTAIGYGESLKMPPTGKLNAEQIAILTGWVKLGAPWPGAAAAPAAASAPPKKEFTPEQKAFWAFQPVKPPAVPKIKNTQWARTPIDNFILAKLEEKSLKPAPPATRATLLRRATFDLTGLPPTEKEIADFLADTSPRAFEKVIDRLLASPRYGERWGRHWLDVARYADSTGNDEDHRYPYAWRYRDYVISAFNDDLPYTRFVREQVAGDLLPSADGKFNDRGVVATGFLALGAKALAQVDKKKMLYDVWDEQVDVTSKAFLGLTLSCARCHDHKFDPLRSQDYYSMVGIFAGTRSFAKSDQGVADPLYRPLVSDADYQAWKSAQAKIRLANLAIEEVIDAEVFRAASESGAHLAEYLIAARGGELPESLDRPTLTRVGKFMNDNPAISEDWRNAGAADLPAVARKYQDRFIAALAAWRKTVEKSRDDVRAKLLKGELAQERLRPGKTDPFFQKIYLTGGPLGVKDKDKEKLCPEDVRRNVAAMRAALAGLKKTAPPDPGMADAVAEDTPVQQKVLLRGDYNSLGEDAPRAVPAILTAAEPAPQAFHGSGRLELAEWMSDPRNPLTARVMVNRVWMWHFGEGIVATPDNFGKMGARPDNPELLDYLASQFVQSGWSVKKLQRMIMLSNAYQMAADTDAKTLEADPENRLLTRFNRQRLSVEEIRDGMLAIDNTLDLTMGGTLQTGMGGDSENAASRLSMNPETLKRRTVYLPLRRSNLPTLLNLFDFGDATTVNGKRALTNVAPQALFMMNSEFVIERAKNVVTPLLSAEMSNRDRLNELYLKILDRRAQPDEIDAAFTYMDRMKSKFKVDDQAAWQSFCHILLTSNEFIYVD